jgi:glyoxylase-like metal-dependent hydrolase (beta-lactamase superfamily II)
VRLLSHFPAIGVSNTYVLSLARGGPAILVDPGHFDVNLLNLIEENNLYISAVLVTHDHQNHVDGLKTLLKVYNAEIIAGNSHVRGFGTRTVHEGTVLEVAGMPAEVLNVEGHSADSRVYKIGPYMFTGDVLSAGRVGSTPNNYSRELLITSIRRKIMVLDGDLLILPGHGPPTTVSVEQKWNPDLCRPDRDGRSD